MHWQQPEQKPQRSGIALLLRPFSTAFILFNFSFFFIWSMNSLDEIWKNNSPSQYMKCYFEQNEAYWGEQWQPYHDAAAFIVFANCLPGRNDGKNMSLSWEQWKQDLLKLYNSVPKLVSFVCLSRSFQHIVWSGEDNHCIQWCHWDFTNLFSIRNKTMQVVSI